MICFDVDSGDEGERRKEGGEGHTGGLFPIQDEGLKIGIRGARQAKCPCRVGGDRGL